MQDSSQKSVHDLGGSTLAIKSAWSSKAMCGRVGHDCMVNKQNLRKEVSDALVVEGFKRSDRVHSLRVDGDFSLWVDTGPIGSRVDIAPFIGIRHDGIKTLRAELLRSTVISVSGTVGANVGYVLGRGYLSWVPPTSAVEVVSTIQMGLERLRGS